MTTPSPPSYAGYRFPAEIIGYAVWLYFRFPLSLRDVDEILAASRQPRRRQNASLRSPLIKLTVRRYFALVHSSDSQSERRP
jgi:hypothetical protein